MLIKIESLITDDIDDLKDKIIDFFDELDLEISFVEE